MHFASVRGDREMIRRASAADAGPVRQFMAQRVDCPLIGYPAAAAAGQLFFPVFRTGRLLGNDPFVIVPGVGDRLRFLFAASAANALLLSVCSTGNLFGYCPVRKVMTESSDFFCFFRSAGAGAFLLSRTRTGRLFCDCPGRVFVSMGLRGGGRRRRGCCCGSGRRRGRRLFRSAFGGGSGAFRNIRRCSVWLCR